MSTARKDSPSTADDWLAADAVYQGDAADLIRRVRPESVACSIWSPPYHVGKGYERDRTFDEWAELLREVIQAHQRVLVPGGFLVVNIADMGTPLLFST